MCSPTDSVEIVGDFTESVVISTNDLTIYGDGDVSGSPAFDLLATADNTTIDGMLIDGIHVTAGSNANNIINNCFYAGIVEDDCVTDGINNWDGNTYWDFLTNGGFDTEYWIGGLGFPQKDANVGNAGAAFVDPVGPAPAELLWGTDVDYSLEFTFDDVCLSEETCAKIVEFTVSWNENKLDYVYYTDGDGMPGNGQYLIDASDVANGNLIVTATSLDDVMCTDGNLGVVTFNVIGAPGLMAAVTTNCVAYELDESVIPMIGASSGATQIIDNGMPTIAYTVNDPYGDNFYNHGNQIDVMTCDITDDVDLHAAWFQLDGGGYGGNHFVDLLNTGTPPPFVIADALTAPVDITFGYLPDGGPYLMDFRVDDHFGNSTVVTYEFYIDITAPTLSTFSLAGDACAQVGYTDGVANVMTTTSDADISMIDIRYYTGGDPWTYVGYQAYDGTIPVDLTGGADGVYVFQVQLKDIHTNESGWSASQTITLDQASGVAALAFGSARYNSLTGVDWDATGSSVPGYFAHILTEDAAEAVDCTSPNWTSPWAATGTFDFADVGDGTYTLYIGIMDVAGNIITNSTTFEFDTRGPKVYSAVINSGDDCTNDLNTTVTVSYKSRGGDTWNGVGFSTVPGGPFTGYLTVPVSATTTTADVPYPFGYTIPDDYTVYVMMMDDLGNTDGEAGDDIWVDGINPVLGSVVTRDLDYPEDGDGTPIDAQWSNSTTIAILFNGVTETGDFDFVISEVGDFSDEVLVNVGDASVTETVPGDFRVEYALLTPIADGDLAVAPMCKIRDCSGRESAADDDDNGINFDFMSRDAATITSFDAVAAMVNYLTSVDFNIVASDAVSGVMSMKIYEVGYQSLTTWEAFASPAEVDLQAGDDGERTVRIKVADKAGNITGYVEATVIVDTEAPAGAVDVISTNPVSYAGEPHAYTNVKPCEVIIDVPGDAVSMKLRNHNPNGAWSTIAIVTPGAAQSETPWNITWNANDFDWVEVKFMDAALNWSIPIKDSIMVDNITPPAFMAYADEGIHHGDGTDIGVWWDNSYAGHYFSNAFYMRWGDYPVYEGVLPPQPTSTVGQGFPIATSRGINIPDDQNEFTGTGDDTEDIYRVSVYNVDSAGNATINTPGNDIATSYILGDLDFDGKISFMESEAKGLGDFARFASAYYSVDDGIDPYWDDACDFSDHFNAFPYPEPDDVVDIMDLMDFVINYTNYHNGWPAAAKFAPTHGPVAIAASLPDALAVGEQVTIAFNIDDPAGILGLHMVFELGDNLEVVKVEKGEMFNTEEKTFFYKDTDNGNLLIDGVIFSEDGFKNQEIAQVTLQAKANIATFTLDNVEMLVRDAKNQDVEAVFNTTIEKTVLLPTEFSLSQNYPNPFNPSTSIELALPVASNYLLEIYNIAGQKVESFSGYSEAGIVNVIWEASNAASGVYFYKVSAGTFEATKKMVLIK
ncbi:T9SS type A sorting domain-containing protein [Neptuniibacter sp.]|uniref:T9SS type A sorting domain-containing protein n=1 Tax=Neptuniibacter sp. TaxID=1962643 RepID=UPI002614FFB5|nr:T9SS type A sorting domain-containing protein [Neptuniibacter sp.]MCP4597928.1 T9SS type A sorting domain-containing protein [Neptuniibacter sp.]